MIKRYDKFIESRKYRTIPEGTYTEKHHRLPKCMGGSDEEGNLIILTAREHYIAHKMLFRENKYDTSLTTAFHMMTNAQKGGRKYNVTSRDYSSAKEAFIKMRTGYHHTEEAKRKMSESSKGVCVGERNGMYGKHHTEESRLKMSENSKGEKNGMYGHQYTEEEKKKLSMSSIGKNAKPIRITNLITNEVKEFSTARCEECRDFLGYKNINSSTSSVSQAIKKNNGIIYRGLGKKRYKAFKVEYI